MRRSSLLALALASWLSTSPGLSEAPTLTPPEYRRPADQTYLTFPEWFLVHSPSEFATYTEGHSPDGFPFFGHIGQLWTSYLAVTGATRDGDPNVGYHVMILVIATSTTVEYGLRGAYESLVGRLTGAIGSETPTDEERFGAKVAREYVDFIEVRPWYEFDFVRALTRLYADVPWAGANMVRKLERRYLLTSEYLAKAAYARLIAVGTEASYEAAAPTTAVVLDEVPSPLPRGVDLQVIESLGGGAVLARMPRYQAFGRQALLLAEAGARFREIAGNRGPILVSALGPRGASGALGRRILFVQPILTRPREERVVLEVPVASLSATLRTLAAHGFALEHVYDF